jgi:tRNA(Ile)-lysidine synthetase-like protein
MIRLCIAVKNIRYVACSGGVDSMALLHFLRQANKEVEVAFYNHNTETSFEAEKFVIRYCLENGIPFTKGWNQNTKPKQDSWEEFWRNERYKFLHSLKGEVATAHHLNDVAETYLFGCIHGRPKFIHREFHNVVRPLLLTPKSVLISWCKRHKVPFIEDESNKDTRFNRNRIRHNILPEIHQVNPGFLTVIKRLQKEKWAGPGSSCGYKATRS